MKITSSFVGALGVAILLGGPVLSQDATPDTVVADVNGTKITVGHVLDVKRQLPDQYKSLGDDRLFEGIVTQLIQQTLLADTIDDPSWIDTAMENGRRALVSTIAIDDVRANAVTEEALQAAYACLLYTSPSPRDA